MNKYVLEEYISESFNASSKARKDVSEITLVNGYVSIGKNDKRGKTGKIPKIFLAFSMYGKMLQLHSNDLLFVQTSMIVLRGVIIMKKLVGFKIIYLIHDLFILKYDKYSDHRVEIDEEIKLINNCDYIICHNERMRDKLVSFGCTSKIFCLELFDYLTDDSAKEDTASIGIAFAGNLLKSGFLTQLDQSNLDCECYVYGKPEMKFNHLLYMGSYPADELLHVLRGGLGLVWEGDYQIKISDNYVRINNPHKASMYFAAGLPIIVWAESAIADFVNKYHVGVCINSLDELNDILKKTSKTEYEEMRRNVLTIRKKLISGRYLSDVLIEIEKQESTFRD